MRQQPRFKYGDTCAIYGSKRLVQQPQRCTCQEQTRQIDAPVLARGQRMARHILVTVQTHRCQRRIDGLWAEAHLPRHMPRQVFTRRQQTLDRTLVAEEQLWRETLHAAAETVAREPGKKAQQAGLAGAIGTLDLHQLAALQCQLNTTEQLSPAPLQTQFPGPEQHVPCRALARHLEVDDADRGQVQVAINLRAQAGEIEQRRIRQL